MLKFTPLLFLIPLLIGACCTQAPEWTMPNTRILFSGESSQLDDWAMAGPGSFVHEGDEIYATGGMGLYWYKAQDFGDFELKLEWRVDEASYNSGVFVRFPDPGDNPWVAVNEGYEIQVCDTADDKHNTGSIYSFQGASHIPTKPVGEWNEYRISVVGQQYDIYVNGEHVNSYVGDRSERGYVGIQNHDDASPVRYRNIQVWYSKP